MHRLTLTWQGSSHSLTFHSKAGGGLRGVFTVDKPEETQVTSFDLPTSITFEMIEDAWKQQGKQWDQLFVCDGQPFVAVRIIQISKEFVILWHVYHLYGRPYDAVVAKRGDLSMAPRTVRN